MNKFSDKLSERFMNLAIDIIKLDRYLYKSYSGRHIYSQLFRSGTSAGANYEEARSGESRADFLHKMQLVLKELRESHYWLKLIDASEIASSSNVTLKSLLSESKELSDIIAKSIITTKSHLTKP